MIPFNRMARNKLSLRRAVLSSLVGLAAGLTLAAPAQAVDGPIRVLSGYPAGSGNDALARVYADALSKKLGVPAIVENRPGAGGLLGMHALKTATPASNTLQMTMDHQIIMLPLIVKEPNFDPKRDAVPVARFTSFNTCLVAGPASKANSLQEYVEAVRKDANQGNYGVPAPGSQAQFVGFVIAQQFDIPMQPIAYKGAAPAISDLIGGHVPVIVVPCDGVTEHVKAGNARVLGIAAEERSHLFPDTPTFKEQGLKMPSDNFVAVFASPAMPPAVLKEITAATKAMFDDPDVVARINNTGMIASYADAKELEAIVARGNEYWAKQVEASNFVAQ
ncbi:MAG: tripartite tricarboxylate transporter substrate-binding protein [Pigmentiphaga sp.]|nr:tripartite tricarboxylate transporter substrate-binding protein [Pigmentiphaga sp.]